MVHRAIAILSEAQNVWPLASRWLEGLDKFAKDNRGIMGGLEGSMADGVSTAPTLQLLTTGSSTCRLPLSVSYWNANTTAA